MGRPSLIDQREAARLTSPDLLRRLDRLESGIDEPEWVLVARREIGLELLAEGTLGRWPVDSPGSREASGSGLPVRSEAR